MQKIVVLVSFSFISLVAGDSPPKYAPSPIPAPFEPSHTLDPKRAKLVIDVQKKPARYATAPAQQADLSSIALSFELDGSATEKEEEAKKLADVHKKTEQAQVIASSAPVSHVAIPATSLAEEQRPHSAPARIITHEEIAKQLGISVATVAELEQRVCNERKKRRERIPLHKLQLEPIRDRQVQLADLATKRLASLDAQALSKLGQESEFLNYYLQHYPKYPNASQSGHTLR